jgi:putative nucleotidyltransferase with HDIG domain
VDPAIADYSGQSARFRASFAMAESINITFAGDDADDELLVAESRERAAHRVRPRELVTEAVLGGGFVATAIAMATLLQRHRPLSPVALIVWVAVYIVTSRVSFEIGDGYAVPTEIIFVAGLFMLPAPLMPAIVGGASLVARAMDVGGSFRMHPSRAFNGLADSWFAVAPALLLALTGGSHPHWSGWPIYIAALAGQFAIDSVCSIVRAWAASGMPPRMMIPVLRWVHGVDAMLAPIGLVLGFAASDRPYLLLLALPLIGLFAFFAKERTARIDNALELSGAYRGTAMLLGQVVESDDAYTGEHSRGVVELSVAVADRLGLDPRARVRVEFGALLHDIGKISVPKAIINKPGPLDDAEWAVMHRHTIEGEAMLRQIGGLLADVGRVVRSSHEHFDGSGYPDGLAGDEIPIESRIVTCCDAFSAMTTDRPYRAAMPLEAALLELSACAGSQFDPAVANALAEIVAETAPAPPERVGQLI